MRRGVLLAVALLPLLAWGEEPGCGDYLAALGVSAPGLQFDGCRLEEGGQLRQRVAEYSIPGRDARALEARLEQRFGLQPLRFVCCGWEAPSVYAPIPPAGPTATRSAWAPAKPWKRTGPASSASTSASPSSSKSPDRP